MDENENFAGYEGTRVYTSLHGNVMLCGRPRVQFFMLFPTMFLDVLLFHSIYIFVCTFLIWFVLYVLHKNDSIYVETLLVPAFKKLYK